MANSDWINELTEMLSRTAQRAGSLAGSMYENQKLRSEVSAKEREIKKIMAEIGKAIFTRFADGAEYDPEILGMCEEIQEKLAEVDALNKDAASRKGKKLCPACGKEVDKKFMYCPFCGAECPVEEEPEEEPAEEPEEEPEEEPVEEVEAEESETETAAAEETDPEEESEEDAAADGAEETEAEE